MRVFFGGDFVPHDALARAVREARHYVDSPALAAADLRIVNLEVPILARGEGVRPAWGGLSVDDPSCAALRLLRIDAVSLANNHIFDHGAEGFECTAAHLRAAGIASFGAGLREADAHRPYRFARSHGVWGYCDVDGRHLSGIPIARGDRPGVAALTVENVWRDLDAAADVDHAVLFVHWGREHTVLPLDGAIHRALEIARHPKVRLILGAHPHRLQGVRRTSTGPIAFSLGHLHVPGFVLEPPLAMAGFERGGLPITRSYHRVERPTFKAWPPSSRLAAGAVLDTATNRTTFVALWQARGDAPVRELGPALGKAVVFGCRLAALLTRLPAPAVRAWHAYGTAIMLLKRVYWMARSNGVAFAAGGVAAWGRQILAIRSGRRAPPG